MAGARLPFLLSMERTFPILDVAPTGAGVGYPDGIRTFVPGALPGDVVACDWTPPEKGRQSQVIDHFEFVERAAKRAPEPCPHLCGTTACGGCPLGTLLYREQCRLKAKLLEDACRAAGREDWAQLVTPPELFVKQRAFRNKAFFTPLRTEDGIRFGMFAAGTHEKVAVDACPQLIEGDERIETELLGRRFFVGPDTFLQVNPSETERLYKKVLERAAVGPEDKVIDLYSGVGTITLLLAQTAAEVFGVEIFEGSVEAAKENAAANGMDNVGFLASPVGKALESLPFTPDVIVADPAFKGMEEGVPERLAALPARRLVYVSCNPKTFVRDALALERAGLRLTTLETVDLFPGALHVETVGTFERV